MERFGKKEKLKSKIFIDRLFTEGKSLKKYPLRLLYLPLLPGESTRAAVSVPKRRFRKATDRNHLKRLMREGYRKNKYLVTSNLHHSYALMFLYTGREKADYHQIYRATEKLLEHLVHQEKYNSNEKDIFRD